MTRESSPDRPQSGRVLRKRLVGTLTSLLRLAAIFLLQAGCDFAREGRFLQDLQHRGEAIVEQRLLLPETGRSPLGSPRDAFRRRCDFGGGNGGL